MLIVFLSLDLVQARLNPEEAYSDTYAHCKIHPSLILGVCASIIPFPDHNQEDFVIMNQSSIDCGFFWSLFFHSYRLACFQHLLQGHVVHIILLCCIKKMGTHVKEDFGHLDRVNTMGMWHGSYDKLDNDLHILLYYKTTGRSGGFGFATMSSDQEVEAAAR
ncbi:putative DNA-directed RNA polymerase [Rosa chinensis]|uniref:DNA-directed RNA polymerase n=1 Tax=Rosa chinensis TaxID=74649 RepID=A0A2P6RPT2_ROSCH|nr:putative DNA-directed RNA polymerase [Rosa chinensis]